MPILSDPSGRVWQGEDLNEEDPLKKFFLGINETYSFVSCLICGFALTSNFDDHLWRSHQTKILQEDVELIREKLSKYQVVKVPSVPPPVSGLLLQRGLSCSICPKETRHWTSTKKSMATHVSHAHPKSSPITEKAWAQRLTTGSPYFYVSFFFSSSIFSLFCFVFFFFFFFFSLLIIFVCLFVKVQPPPQDDRELFDDDQKPNVLGWIAQLNPQAAAVAVAAAAPAAAPNVDGIHDIPKFFVDTKLCVAPMGFTPARQKFLLAKSEEDQDTAILKVISTWWKAAHENVVADGFWRYGHLFHPLKLSSFQAFKLSSFQALKLSTCVSFFKMCHSHRDLQDLNAYEEGGQHGYFNVVEITAPYLRDLVRLVLFLVRMASDFHDDTEVEEDFVPAKLPEDIRNAATSLSLEPTIVKLQQLLQLLFLPLPTRHARDGHPTALFVHLSVRDADGTLKSVDYISHLSVHLLYSARLATFQQLRTDNPETEEERTTMLKSVKLT